jgi:uncharacterized protein (TIGR00369 family)
MMSQEHGTVPLEIMKSLSGKELLQGIIAGIYPKPSINKALNFSLVEIGEGTAVFEGQTSDAILNPLGTVHGGVALTLIDSAVGCACHTLLKAGVFYTSIETKVNFTRAIMANTGLLRCEGRIIHKGNSIMTGEATIYDTSRKVLAHGTSTLFIMK